MAQHGDGTSPGGQGGSRLPLYPLRMLDAWAGAMATCRTLLGGSVGMFTTRWLPSKVQPTTVSGPGPGRPGKGSGPGSSSCSNLLARHVGACAGVGLGKEGTCGLIPSHVKLSGSPLRAWTTLSQSGQQGGRQKTGHPLSGPGGLWGREPQRCPPGGERTGNRQAQAAGAGATLLRGADAQRGTTGDRATKRG